MHNNHFHAPGTQRLCANIWRGICCASDQEIHDGMNFYPGAHGLCRLFARIFSTTPERVAGIYAALSPMNGWYTNVSNALSVLRYTQTGVISPDYSTNTSSINERKALQIACGADPEHILGGNKVLAFYRAIADPDNLNPIPVDRHLICLALGLKITDIQELRAYAGDSQLYGKIENAYRVLGQRETVGNRLASVAWFVQRRISSTQTPMLHPSAPICCNKPLHRQGSARFYCSVCGKTRKRVVSVRANPPIYEHDIDLPSNTSYTADRRGRIIISSRELDRRFLNSSGWQYLSRYVVQCTINERLHSQEHVHHLDGKLFNCRRNNLAVWLAEHHGRHHAQKQLMYMLRDVVSGRFVPSVVPVYADQVGCDYLDDSDIPF